MIKFLLILDHKSDACPTIEPVIASETNTHVNGKWPARAALVDGVSEGNLPDGKKNMWAGNVNTEAGFVIDLGCVETITKIELRNIDNSHEYG